MCENSIRVLRGQFGGYDGINSHIFAAHIYRVLKKKLNGYQRHLLLYLTLKKEIFRCKMTKGWSPCMNDKGASCGRVLCAACTLMLEYERSS